MPKNKKESIARTYRYPTEIHKKLIKLKKKDNERNLNVLVNKIFVNATKHIKL